LKILYNNDIQLQDILLYGVSSYYVLLYNKIVKHSISTVCPKYREEDKNIIFCQVYLNVSMISGHETNFKSTIPWYETTTLSLQRSLPISQITCRNEMY